MTTARMSELLRQADGTDPLAALRAIAGIREELERREAVLVRRARVRGASWKAIALVLDSSRQAVHRKHGGGWLHAHGGAGDHAPGTGAHGHAGGRPDDENPAAVSDVGRP